MKERSKQGQTNKQGKATQHTQGSHFSMYMYMGVLCCLCCLYGLACFFLLFASLINMYLDTSMHLFLFTHQCTQAYVMSVVMVVNEKWRERVPAWGAFEALPENFPTFFQRVLDACLSPLEVGRGGGGGGEGGRGLDACLSPLEVGKGGGGGGRGLDTCLSPLEVGRGGGREGEGRMPSSLHWRGGGRLRVGRLPLSTGGWEGEGRLCYLMCINFDDHHVHDIMYMYMYMVVSPAELQVHHEGENNAHPLPSLLLQQPGTTCTYSDTVILYIHVHVQYVHTCMLMHCQQG